MGGWISIGTDTGAKTLYHKDDWVGSGYYFRRASACCWTIRGRQTKWAKEIHYLFYGKFYLNQRIGQWTVWKIRNGQNAACSWTWRLKNQRKGRLSRRYRHIRVGWVVCRKGTYSPEGYPLYTYQTYILEDFIEGGKYRNQLDQAIKNELTQLIRKWMSM